MKKFFAVLFSVVFFIACDDGDVIVTTFDFDDESQLNLCGTEENVVLYTVNDNPNETISFNFQNSSIDFDGTFSGDNPLQTRDTISIPLDENNKIIYRTYAEAVEGPDYFCNNIPPGEPAILDEYETTNGGSVEIIITIISQDDNDGVPPELEDLNNNGNYFDDDSDGDGIPNFIDTDDDNDNVLTQIEINVDADQVDENDYPDSDGDGIPDYLDEDDDNDGVLTRYEDLNAYENIEEGDEPNLNPADDRNEDGLPNYLNPEATESLVIDTYRENVITRRFRTRVTARNITMRSNTGEENITLETLNLGFLEVTSNDETIEPNDPEDED